MWSGEYCGDTIAEVFAVNPDRVRWYSEQDTKLGRNARLFLGEATEADKQPWHASEQRRKQ